MILARRNFFMTQKQELLKYSRIKESCIVECVCGEDLTNDIDWGDEAGVVECRNNDCRRKVYFMVSWENDDYREYLYSHEPFPDMCSTYMDLPRCPHCGHGFSYEELYPDKKEKEIFHEIAWDPTEHDYDTVKRTIVTCPHCRERICAAMMPPERPQPGYCTYRLVSRVCETCGETHEFQVMKVADIKFFMDGVMLAHEETGHWQKEAVEIINLEEDDKEDETETTNE
jgi:hypothetical protein